MNGVKLWRMLPWMVLLAADFWILPLFFRDTNVMLMVLIVMPAVCFLASLGCGLL